MTALTKAERSALRQAARAELARRDLLHFTRQTFPGYKNTWYHQHWADKLTAFAQGKIKRLMVFAPPRHGKSELVSRRLPAYIFGINPDARIIAGSYAADLARQMGRAVQRIMDGPEYRAVFPGTRLEGANVRTVSDGRYLRNSDEFEIVGRRGFYKCSGVGGGITGRGFDFGIIDDPVKDAAEAWSETVREAVWEWYTQVFLTRQEGDASILLTMTRWHEDDLAGRILAQDAGAWDIVRFPALSDDYEGGALWPEKFPASWLLNQRKTIGTHSFEALYQQSPAPLGGNIWKDGYIKPCTIEGSRLTGDGRTASLHNLHRFNVADLAYSSKQTADYSVIGTFAGDRTTGKLYLVDMYRARIDLMDSEQGAEHRYWISEARRRNNAEYTVVEKASYSLNIIDHARRQGEPIREVIPDKDKVSRAYSALPLCEAGDFYANRDAPWWPALRAELSAFPNGANDDQCDVVAYGVAHWKEIMVGGQAHEAAAAGLAALFG